MSTSNVTTEPSLCILQCYHKPGLVPAECGLVPIEGGRALRSASIEGTIGDDTGDNISKKNPIFCELTALYWAWRNIDADFYGLMHYRRILNFSSQDSHGERRLDTDDAVLSLGLDFDSLASSVRDFDVILPFQVNVAATGMGETVRDQYQRMHIGSDVDLLRESIEKVAPYTLVDFDAVFEGVITYFYSIFVMRRELFKGYAAWLFAVLFDLEPKLLLDSRDEYQRRVPGFMGERLLAVYVHYLARTRALRIKELPVIWVDVSTTSDVDL